MSVSGSPVLQRRRLGAELRRLREEVGKKLDEVAEYLECSDAKISRIETGKVPALARDVRDMLELYGVPAQDREALLALARDAKRQGWWHRFADAGPKHFTTFIGLEAEAVEVCNYEATFVPGLLQTPNYARSLMLADLNADSEQVERLVRLRMERQKRLFEADTPLRLHAIIDDAVLNRPIGGKQIMDEQVAHLAKMAERPNVTIQLIDPEVGAYPGMGVPFHLMSFPDPGDLDVVFLEQYTSALYLEDPRDTQRYRLVFDRLVQTATPAKSSASILNAMVD